MPTLTPRLQEKYEPLISRWNTFLQKVYTRVQEVITEADAGLDQLIAQHATDHQPIGAAMNTLQSRFHNIGDKVDTGWEKCEELFEELQEQLEDDDELKEDEYEQLSSFWEELRHQYEQANDHVELQYRYLEMIKNGQWARKLYDLAVAEVQNPVRCTQCGGEFQNNVYWQASNQPCPFCQAINEVQPGTAAGLYYQGLGLHAISHEQAWNEWMAERQAEKTFKDRRHATESDFQNYLAAARTYYTKYYQTTQQMNPGFQGTIEEAVEAKLKHYTAHEPPLEKMQRAFFQKLVEAAASGNPQAVKHTLKEMPQGVDIDECAECLVEHGDRRGATLALQVKYDEEGEDEPQARWMIEQLREITHTLRG